MNEEEWPNKVVIIEGVEDSTVTSQDPSLFEDADVLEEMK